MELLQFKEKAGAVVGLGPESTVQLVQLFTKESVKQTALLQLGEVRLPFLMEYAQVPQAAEAQALSGAVRGENLTDIFERIFASTLIQSFKNLESASCTFAYVHCNTLGLVVDAFGIKNEFHNLEVLTIGDTVSTEFQGLAATGIKEVFPIGTVYTVNGISELSTRTNIGGMYDKPMSQAGLTISKPLEAEQYRINQVILDCVQSQSNFSQQVETFTEILAERGVLPYSDCAVLICCTDLYHHGQALRDKGYKIVDTAESAVKYTVKRILESRVRN